MLQILCKTPAAIFKIQIPANTKSKFNRVDVFLLETFIDIFFAVVYSDLSVDYLKMFLLNVPAAVVALSLFFFLDDVTGFEITFLLELQLQEPFSFIFTWFAAVPLIFWLSQTITKFILKDFLILKGPCPNCGTENVSFFGTILSISNGGTTNNLKCSNCETQMVYDSKTRLITLPEGSEA
ncbi:PGR5-like protein 1A, chloroplastic [Vitis vinifera]|uniref:PGR5-like protein 1A, chloroplastic n=1 Tax=Vitis vinifera TaxID=29760 RepID=A0A438BZ82_VITVI|nr:PGR5-like protein 1A, chloroplastic [Vitis vinifera]